MPTRFGRVPRLLLTFQRKRGVPRSRYRQTLLPGAAFLVAFGCPDIALPQDATERPIAVGYGTVESIDTIMDEAAEKARVHQASYRTVGLNLEITLRDMALEPIGLLEEIVLRRSQRLLSALPQRAAAPLS